MPIAQRIPADWKDGQLRPRGGIRLIPKETNTVRQVAERRVVVTGLGVVAPNGIGKDQFWSACANGQSAVAPIRSFDASHHPVRIAAEVPAFDITPFVPTAHRKTIKIMSRAMRFAVAAAGLAA